MVTETQKRIEAYRELLPGLREKVTAVAFLLALSVIMLTSASYAWLTISRAPEVTAVSTNIAANGSLEIALATGDGKTAPGDSKVGDSSAAEGQSIVNANKTWGNLINLNDPSYGLDKLVLRPAQLNKSNLQEKPLYGAVYQTDGRIEKLNTEFGYVSWEEPSDAYPQGRFKVDGSVGVRGVASVIADYSGLTNLTAKEILRREKIINDYVANAGGIYIALTQNTDYMGSLANMMGAYMTVRMAYAEHVDLKNPNVAINDVKNLKIMYEGFLDAFDEEAMAMVEIANLALYLQGKPEVYTDVNSILSTTDAKLKADKIQISGFAQFVKDYTIIKTDLEKITTICDTDATEVAWVDSGLNAVVNNLVNVGTCTVTNAKGDTTLSINEIGASNATKFTSGTNEAKITNGILYRFEERTGFNFRVYAEISATVRRSLPLVGEQTITQAVKANIETTAPRDYNLFARDLEAAKALNSSGAVGTPDYNAEDTYALAVDFWVRTNAAGSYLTLEGNIISTTEYEDETKTLYDGTVVNIYTVSVNIDGTDYESDVYKHNGKWYNAGTQTELTADEMTMLDPENKAVKKQKEITIVSGYEGVNRIWKEEELIDIEDPTTQGSGSCYVYYADTPEDQARSLKLLESLKVAFVGSNGTLLTEAVMDTEHHYAANGRVVVPLVLTDGSINLGTDIQGKTNYAIMPLEQNRATKVTAIVYLDGTKLTNDDVLAAADIQGQLNIQFGSSAEMSVMDKEELKNETRSVSASVTPNKFVYDKASAEAMTVTVTVNVDGTKPENVSAFFLREINSTQGSREGEMKFIEQSDGSWQATYTFKKPGKYVLRTVRLDGQEYELDSTELPRVEIEGFQISSLTCVQADENNNISVMTEKKTYTADFVLDFAVDSPDKMPSSVEGRFLDENGSATTIDFSYNNDTELWEGKATFISSGSYELQFLVFDGVDYNELPENMRYSATLFLGMGVEVRTNTKTTFPYDPNHPDFRSELDVSVKIIDDTGAEQKGYPDVKITYHMRGSTSNKIDADLTWDGTYYSGKLPNKGPGVWVFGMVEIGKDVQTKNTLTNAPDAPVFTIISLDPPEVLSENNTESYQLAPEGNATMNVNIKNSSSATVKAVITDGKGTERTVEGRGGETDENTKVRSWTFDVPDNISGSKDGNWTLTKVLLENVFVDNVQHDETNPLIVEISGNTTKVVHKPNVKFEGTTGTTEFGKTGGSVTGAFAESYTVSEIKVVITDFDNQPIKADGITASISYAYGNDSSVYGGYTGPTDADGNFDIALSSTDGKTFTQAENKTLNFAGSYAPTLTYTISYKNDNNITVVKEYILSGNNLPQTAPRFTVSSVVPNVSITEAYYTSTSSQTAASFTPNSTTVYAHTYRNEAWSFCGSSGDYAAYHQPYVTLTMSGYGKATEAKIAFTTNLSDNLVRLYTKEGGNNSTITTTYVWSGDGGCKRWIGLWEEVSGDDKRESAGTLTGSKLVITAHGVPCEVDITDIIINNPN